MINMGSIYMQPINLDSFSQSIKHINSPSLHILAIAILEKWRNLAAATHLCTIARAAMGI